jgi:hypothetical protein
MLWLGWVSGALVIENAAKPLSDESMQGAKKKAGLRGKKARR